jgi:DNA-binding transcriptional ArsR family regulator
MVRDGLAELDDFEVVFGALSHATRRHILAVLNARGGSMTAGDIAGRFHHSWPTISRHLKVLNEAGLVRIEKRGQQRVYHLEGERLTGVVETWIRAFRAD